MHRSLAFLALACSAAAFVAPSAAPALRTSRASACNVRMGKEAADGVFSPFVKAAKFVLGDKKLNSIRGDVIAQHSKVPSDAPISPLALFISVIGRVWARPPTGACAAMELTFKRCVISTRILAEFENFC
jgi:hypothetical protein